MCFDFQRRSLSFNIKMKKLTKTNCNQRHNYNQRRNAPFTVTIFVLGGGEEEVAVKSLK